MMATEIIKIDASWAEKWTKTGVPFLSAPTVDNTVTLYNSVKMLPDESSLAMSTSSYIFKFLTVLAMLFGILKPICKSLKVSTKS